MNSPPAITADQVPQEWIGVVREIIRREGRAIRFNPITNYVEVKSLHDNSWGKLMLPTGAFALASEIDGAMVLNDLTRADWVAPEPKP